MVSPEWHLENLWNLMQVLTFLVLNKKRKYNLEKVIMSCTSWKEIGKILSFSTAELFLKMLQNFTSLVHICKKWCMVHHRWMKSIWKLSYEHFKICDAMIHSSHRKKVTFVSCTDVKYVFLAIFLLKHFTGKSNTVWNEVDNIQDKLWQEITIDRKWQ